MKKNSGVLFKKQDNLVLYKNNSIDTFKKLFIIFYCRPKYEVMTLAMHEGVPGHHFQVSK